MKDIAAIILAAGKGTRFNQGKDSTTAKVLYKVGGKEMARYSLDILHSLGVDKVVLVVGHKSEQVRRIIGGNYSYVTQAQAKGTGDAAAIGLESLDTVYKDVIVLYGADIYSEKTLRDVIETHQKESAAVTFVTMVLDKPDGFGRVVRNQNGDVVAIVEEKVATVEQKKIKEVNDGCFVFKTSWVKEHIKSLKLSGVKEYFLTDLIEEAIKEGSKVSTYTVSHHSDWMGIDSPEDIKTAEKFFGGGK